MARSTLSLAGRELPRHGQVLSKLVSIERCHQCTVNGPFPEAKRQHLQPSLCSSPSSSSSSYVKEVYFAMTTTALATVARLQEEYSGRAVFHIEERVCVVGGKFQSPIEAPGFHVPSRVSADSR